MQPDQVMTEETVERDQPEAEEPIINAQGQRLSRNTDYWGWHYEGLRQLLQ